MEGVSGYRDRWSAELDKRDACPTSAARRRSTVSVDNRALWVSKGLFSTRLTTKLRPKIHTPMALLSPDTGTFKIEY